MDQPAAGPVPSAPIAGLFGKLPLHGDFVRRGWADETVDAIDGWLTGTMSAARATRDDAAFADWMHGAPLWRGYVPAGRLGPQALHLAVAPSIDRAGRLFPVVAGVAGDGPAAWRHAALEGAVVDAAIYDALAGHADADAVVAAIAGSIVNATGEAGVAPATSRWWLAADGAPLVESGPVDAALLGHLLNEGRA